MILILLVILLWVKCTSAASEPICLLVMVWLLGNAHTLNLVDTALFCLAFEDSDSVDPFKLSRLFLCGDAASRLLITVILNDI